MLRHLTAACLAALFALPLVAGRASAKPPDLPDDDPIIVAVPEPTYLATSVEITIVCPSGEIAPEQLSTMPKVESACPYRPAPADRRALTAADP